MFADNLKYLRTRYNMEQSELAERLGRKSSSSISEWEKGKYTPLNIHFFICIVNHIVTNSFIITFTAIYRYQHKPT